MRHALLSLVFVALSAATTFAAGNRFALVVIDNPTDMVLHYQFAWGNGEYKSITLQPGEAHWHSFEYDYADQNSSPVPYVRFDTDLRDGVKDVQTFALEAYASPDQNPSNGKIYSFGENGSGVLVLRK